MTLVDTHAHLDEEGFDKDRAEIIERAVAAGVVQMVSIGTTADSSRRAVEIAAQYPQVFAAVGIHPNYLTQVKAGDWEVIEELVRAPRVVAIGETGLDRYWDTTPFALQIEYFQKQMDLSQRADLPFVVHAREAEADVVTELRHAAGRGSLRGVMHSFTGDLPTALACVELGMHISFAGMITYKRSQALRDLIKEVPLDRILVETDSPYLAAQPVRGKRNEPSYVVHTAQVVADLRGLPLEELGARTTANARSLFRLPVP